MSTNLNYKQVANVKRRTWDVEAYEKKAKDRADAEAEAEDVPPGGKGRPSNASEESAPKRFKTDEIEVNKEEFKPAEPGAAGPMGSQRAFLQPRQGKVDIDSKVGDTEIISAEAAAKTSLNEGGSAKDGVTKSGVGWHCSVCDCFLKDSMTYLDHINGRKHQRKLGYSMRVERSTKDQMMGRLTRLTKEKERAAKKADTAKFETSYEDVVKAKDKDEAKRKAERTKKRQEKKQAKRAGLVKEPEEDGGGEEEEAEDENINPDLATMMGFSGFGGGTKNG